jgi:hypothetical protein
MAVFGTAIPLLLPKEDSRVEPVNDERSVGDKMKPALDFSEGVMAVLDTAISRSGAARFAGSSPRMTNRVQGTRWPIPR